MVRGLLFIGVVVAVLAFAAAYVLDSKAQKMWWKHQAIVAALIGGNLPVVLLGLALYFSGDPRTQSGTIFIGPAIMGQMLSALIGYPTAYLFLRRCQRAREADIFK